MAQKSEACVPLRQLPLTGDPDLLHHPPPHLQPGQGHRSDLEQAIASLGGGGSVTARLKRAAAEAPAAFVKYHRGLEALATLTAETPKVPKPAWRPWQAELERELSEEPDDRHIYWVSDEKGGAGKSTFLRYYINNEELNATSLTGKLADMAYAYDSQRIVFFDVSRTQAENLDHLMTMAEWLKNGNFVSPKYQSRLKTFSPPHVVFFANVPCPPGKWSADRVIELKLE